VVGCIDLRAPAEIIVDVGIGDTFNVRIAGNVVNDDLLGSLEFACAAIYIRLDEHPA
jgi:carbonic anhydrase